jgi:hypothetical protein
MDHWEGAVDFLARVPHAKVTHADRTTHMIAGDHNDAFTNAIASFLSTTAR